jgi:hypothetical protein
VCEYDPRAGVLRSAKSTKHCNQLYRAGRGFVEVIKYSFNSEAQALLYVQTESSVFQPVAPAPVVTEPMGEHRSIDIAVFETNAVTLHLNPGFLFFEQLYCT